MSSNVHSPIDQFDQIWGDAQAADLFAFLKNHSPTIDQVKELVLVDQHHRWRCESALPINAYLEKFPELSNDSDWLAEFALEELGYYLQRNPDATRDEFVDHLALDNDAVLSAVRTEFDRDDSCSRVNEVVAEKTPESIGRFRVERELGRGAFGRVYLARDLQLDRRIAIKVASERMNRQLGHDEAALAEARMVAAIEHEAIVPVYEFGHDENCGWYIVSKFLSGGTLADRMNGLPSDPVSMVVKLGWVIRIADGLQAAHEKGIFHRDIKPANILIDEHGQPCLTDFGLACSGSEQANGSMVGTPAWMSPEQARGEGHLVDSRSDIFSLGVILYELLAGRRPFVAETTSQLLDQIGHQNVVSPRQWSDEIPLALERICMKALARRQNDRFQTANGFAKSLRQYLTQTNNAQAEQETQIVPTGLRAFDDEHSDFFLTLLPGPHTVDGIPESVHFWTEHCSDSDPANASRVSLLYGQCGCGKSSLLRAGIVPRLNDSVKPVVIDAERGTTAERLKRTLIHQVQGVDSSKDLVAILRELRSEKRKSKILIVIDQAEQWLQDYVAGAEQELAEALRQCDGVRVQCLLSIRDDFWMATTQLFRDLDIRLTEGVNSRGLEPFGRVHATKVLHALGRAHGRIPLGQLDAGQVQFLDDSVEWLVEDGRVSPIKLCLLAEMLRDRPWTPETLDSLGGLETLGEKYLAQAFGETAPPSQRAVRKDALDLLTLLTPSEGVDVKKPSQPKSLLVSEVGDACFDRVATLLDDELHLISAIENEETDQQHFQLTHDFMIPSIQRRIRRQTQSTLQGWLTLRLKDNAGRWEVSRAARQLPKLWETAAFTFFTERDKWSETESKMVAKAVRLHVAIVVAAIAVFGIAGWVTHRIHGQHQANIFAQKLLTARTVEVPKILDEAEPYQYWMKPILESINPANEESVDADTVERRQLHIDLALLKDDSSRCSAVVDRMLSGSREQAIVLREQIVGQADAVTLLWEACQDLQRQPKERLRAACALSLLDAENAERWKTVARPVTVLLTSNRVEDRSEVIESLRPVSKFLVPELRERFGETGSAEGANDEIADNAAKVLGRFFAGQPSELLPLIRRASPTQLMHLLPAVQQRRSDALKVFSTAWQESKARDQNLEEVRADANIASALIHLGETEVAEAALRSRSDDTLRTNVIHRYGRSGSSLEPLLELIDLASTDSSVDAGILLTIGESDTSAWSSAIRERVLRAATRLFRESPHANVHSAAEWLLRRLGRQKTILEIQSELATGDFIGDRQWYITENGLTMVRVAGATEVLVGSDNAPDALPNETDSDFRWVEGPFAISTTEVTVDQWEKFRKVEINGRRIAELATERPYGPALQLGWFEAVGFCVAMDQQAGIVDVERCYQNTRQGTLMRSHRFDRLGHQLPSIQQWVYAAAGGTVTPRFFGRDSDWLAEYAWTSETSAGSARSVGMTKPNNFGLFDTLGNAVEWTSSSPLNQHEYDDARELSVNFAVPFRMAGGAFNSPFRLARVGAVHNVQKPGMVRLATGIRVIRMLNE